jgi:hypothetical protein
MTWIYVPHTTSSTVSADTEDSSLGFDSPTRTPNSARSPISNGTNTANGSSKPGSKTATSMTLQSGEGTSENLTASPGVGSWISSLRVHRVPVSRSPAAALEARMTEICSRKRSDYLTRYDRATSSWKMSQASLWEDNPTFGTFSADWPRLGFMTADGTLYRLKMPKPLTNGPAGGASPDWPTPVADGDRQTNYAQGGTALGFAARMFPTPRAGKTTDEDEESWLARHAAGKVATPPLALAARMLPTPSSGGDSGGPHGIRGGSWAKEKLVETFGEEDAVAMSGGSLSPDWVSWLMGLPVGWTSLEPLPREEYLDWFHSQMDGTWWQEERGLPRVSTGIKDRVNRLKCLGNGIVPASLALFLRGTR